jgi:gliding motility-associated-like protein
MNMKKLYTFVFCLIFSVGAVAQVNVVMNANGTFYSCGGAFLDSGDQGGPGYSNDEYFTVTICPEIEGDVVTVDFVTFDLDETGNQNSWDNMAIYDGDNTGATPLGSYSGTALQGLFVTATPLNTSGCLTFVFDSNNAGTGNFVGSITCDTPCDRPVAVGTYDAPEDHRICVNEVINFDGSESYAAPGFAIVEWLWDFGDGTTDTSGPIVSHSWPEPGEYIVELYLVDDNGCASTNRISLQVLVATYPSWSPFPGDTTLCLGEEVCFEAFPDDYEVTWAGPEVTYDNPVNTELPDNVGECFESVIDVAGFGPGQTLTNINDLFAINIAIEHSFLFDLVISVECPNGQSVILHQQMAQTIGPNVGANGTDLGVVNTEFWDYAWTPDATQGTWSEVATTGANGSLPEGDYNSLEPLDQLVGCELNGAWTISVCDLWGGDSGELDSWGLAFNPAIVPDVTEFTPDIGAGADSSFWSFDTSGLDILEQSADGNTICVLPTEEGVWPFTYSVMNNHGCGHDSTLTVSVALAGQADAGPDVVFCGDLTVLQGGLDGQPSPSCGNDAGNYSYCYGEGENTSWTYCPDNPGDGITFIDVTFNTGSTENFFDEFWVFDGDNTGAPLLAGPIYGSLSGMSWIASNATGCLTFQITADGSVSCQSGSQEEWNWDVGCSAGGPQYVFEWTPSDGLSDPNVPNPEVLDIPGQTEYTLTAYPLGHPACASTDVVLVNPAFAFIIDSQNPSCYGNDGVISIDIDENSGEGPWEIIFTQNGVVQQTLQSAGGLTEFTDLFPDDYSVSVSAGGCTYVNNVVIDAPEPVMFELVPDTIICVDGLALLEAWSENDPDNSWTYTWDNGLGIGSIVGTSPTVTTSYSVIATDDFGCESSPLEVEVAVRDSITVEISGPDLICTGTSAMLQVDDTNGGIGNPYEYVWEFNGQFVSFGANIANQTSQTGEYCVYASDGCESPDGVACHVVTVETPIQVQFEADTTRGCFPAPIAFTNLIDNDLYSQELWQFGDGSSTLAQDPVHLFENPGLYDITLTLTSDIGCVYSTTYDNYITVFDNPFVGYHATPQPTTVPDTEISFFEYAADDVVDYYWVFDAINYMGTSDLPNPVFEFPISVGGIYPVSLTVTDVNGCTSKLTRFIEVNDLFNVFIPNTFSPNNDGINDVFFVTGTDIDPSRFTLQIFNRWGDKMFETNDPNVVWNGAGAENSEFYSQNEVYICNLIVYSITTAERKEITGTVTMMR